MKTKLTNTVLFCTILSAVVQPYNPNGTIETIDPQ